MNANSLAIIDNDSWTVSAMVDYLSRYLSDADIMWTACSGQESLPKFRETGKPRVLLIDISLGDMSGIDVIRRIRQYDGTTAAIAMTAFPPERYAAAVRHAGGQALVGKRPAAKIVDTVIQVRQGQVGEAVAGVSFLTVPQAYIHVSAEKPTGIDALSPTERSIVELCAKGLTSLEIAAYLGKAPATINTHLQRALDKAGARNRVHLVAMWLQSKNMM